MTKTQQSTLAGGETMINNHWPKGGDGKNTCRSWLGRNGQKAKDNNEPGIGWQKRKIEC